MKLYCDIHLPASKSESNRALMIAAYGGFSLDLQELSDSQDTRVLANALCDIHDKKQVIYIADCGTAARFLTTYLACQEGDWLLTGSERMKQRPIKLLVDTLAKLGADILYVEKQGFLPLQIHGKPLLGGKVSVDMSPSSQFASSLILAAPMFPLGMDLELLGKPNSMPYLDMTLSLMQHFGAEVERNERTIRVRPKPYQSTGFAVSSDWSAASYWYEIAAFCTECEIKLHDLSLPSLQGDSVIAEWMKSFGVCTTPFEDGFILTKIPFVKQPLFFDFTDCPDLYPTVAATCAGLNVEARFTGINNLSLKESDRVEAMQMELAKLGSQPLRFCAHDDHRVVMALAPLALLNDLVTFDHPEVVGKSYPGFWEDAAFLFHGK